MDHRVKPGDDDLSLLSGAPGTQNPAIAAFPIASKTLYGAARLCPRQSQIID
jgi:hypothetical protein